LIRVNEQSVSISYNSQKKGLFMIDGYSIALIVHLFAAIFFIGFVFTDVVVLPVLNKEFDASTVQKIKETISGRARAIFPAK
jgi:hypothetical protein